MDNLKELHEMLTKYREAEETKMRVSDNPRDRAYMHMRDTSSTLEKKITKVQFLAAIVKDVTVFEMIAALFEDVISRIDSVYELITSRKEESEE